MNDRGRTRALRTGPAAIAASLLWVGSSAADSGVVVAKGPYVTGLSDTSADVRFELSAPSSASVVLTDGVDAGGVARVFRDAPGGMHVIHVDGLHSARLYAYAVRAASGEIGHGSFETGPALDADSPLTFLVYGDTRSDPAAHAEVVRAMTATAGTFLIHTGDMVAEGGKDDDWQSFFDIEHDLLGARPLFVSIGNHELLDDLAGANFARYAGFSGPRGVPHLYGSVRIGRARFFFLNGMHDWASGEEHDWLLDALTRADAEVGLLWRIAVVHHGPWSSGPHGPNVELVDAHIPELLAAHGIDLIVSGHDHIYERGVGALKYIVSGGGGAPLYRITDDRKTTSIAEATYHFVQIVLTPDDLRLKAWRADGTVLDECGFRKGSPRWDCDPPPEKARPIPPAGPSPRSARCSCGVVGARQRENAGSFVPPALLGLLLIRRRRAFGSLAQCR